MQRISQLLLQGYGLYLKRLYFISSVIAYCISPHASFYAGFSCLYSQVLMCCYIDKPLFNLGPNGIGCFIGKVFVGAFAYADDIVLITSTSRAMRRTLSTCDSFADNLSIVLNAKNQSVQGVQSF